MKIPSSATGPSPAPHASSAPARAAPSREAAARFVEVLGEGTRAGAQPTGRPPPTPGQVERAQQGTTDRLRRALATAMKSESSIDALLAAAQRGRTFSASELLAMQATVFRYSQTVEVVSRATDRLVGGIKQTLSTPV